MKLTARLSKPGTLVSQLLKQNHELNGPVYNWANITGSELYYGTSFAGEPEWVSFLSSGTSTRLDGLRVEGAAGLLFVPVNNRLMIFSFGHTNQHFSGRGLERDFGLRVVLNTVDPSKLKSIDSKIVSNVIINKRTQISKEKKIQDFGFEINKDFLKHVAGKSSIASFATVVSGSDSLILNCDLTVGTLSQKVTDIYAHYISTAYQSNYSWIDNVKNIKDGALLPTLNSAMVTEFNSLLGSNPSDLYIACPEVIEFDRVDHYRIRGYGSREHFYFLDIEGLIVDLRN